MRRKRSGNGATLKALFLLAAIGVLLIVILFLLPEKNLRQSVSPTPSGGAAVLSTGVPREGVVAESGDTGSEPAGIGGDVGVEPEPAVGSEAAPAAAVGPVETGPETKDVGTPQPQPVSVRKTPVQPAVTKPLPEKPAARTVSRERSVPVKQPVRISVVIDDVGNNTRHLEPFLRFPGPITFAVLPGLSHTADSAEAIRKAGKQAILHQPMEAVGGTNPGPGALYRSMSDQEIVSVLRKNLEQVRGVAGMNNHQGSAITSDTRIMGLILRELSARKLFFLDSMTTSESVAGRLADEIQLDFLERDVFLDNDSSEKAIRAAFENGLQKARSAGSVVMIGHVWSADLAAVLSDLYPSLLENGFEFSYLEELLPSVTAGKRPLQEKR